MEFLEHCCICTTIMWGAVNFQCKNVTPHHPSIIDHTHTQTSRDQGSRVASEKRDETNTPIDLSLLLAAVQICKYEIWYSGVSSLDAAFTTASRHCRRHFSFRSSAVLDIDQSTYKKLEIFYNTHSSRFCTSFTTQIILRNEKFRVFADGNDCKKICMIQILLPITCSAISDPAEAKKNFMIDSQGRWKMSARRGGKKQKNV